MKIKSILLVLVFLILSCAKETKQENVKILKLKQSKEKRIKISENIYYHSFLSQIQNNQDTVFLYRKRTHTKENGIDVFDFKNSNYLKSIIIPKEGPSGIDNVRGFYYLNKDSIFIVGTKEIIIYNDNKNKVIYRSAFLNEYFPVAISNLTKPFYLKNELYFAKHSFTPPTNNKFFETNIIAKFNFITNKLSEIEETKFSNKYIDKCWSHYDAVHSHTLNTKNNKLVFSFAIDDSLYVKEIQKDKKSYFAKSSYKTREVKDLNCSKVRQKERRQKYTNYFYNSIIFDKYKNVYYRLMLIPEENYNEDTKFKRINRQFIITVLDSNFTIIGETRVLNKEPKYIYFDWVLNEEGLWISTANPNNKKYDEDYLTYELVDYEK